MLDRCLRILNFDHSIIKQQELLSLYPNQIVDFSDIASRARLWLDWKMQEEVKRRLQQTNPASVTFIGSGDFHHLSYLLLSAIEGPLSLIVFDFHPDWESLPPKLGCGSWLSAALKKRNILKCISLGVSSSDISTWHLQSADLKALSGSRLEIYPYTHRPSRVFFRVVPENASLKLKRGFCHTTIAWSALKEVNLSQFTFSLLERLPSKRVYISLDKDCLEKDYAVTNWEEGQFSLKELLLMLKIMRENLDITGLDICGDYSRINIKGRLKSFCSQFDHPKDTTAQRLSDSAITRLNQETNLEILRTIFPDRG